MGSILLVEDTPDLLRLLRDLLSYAGLSVHTAGSGAEALAVYQRSRAEIALVLTDVVMPGMSGVQLIRALKGVNPDVRFCFMTVYSTAGLLAEGPLEIFQKPFADPAALVARLQQLSAGA